MKRVRPPKRPRANKRMKTSGTASHEHEGKKDCDGEFIEDMGDDQDIDMDIEGMHTDDSENDIKIDDHVEVQPEDNVDVEGDDIEIDEHVESEPEHNVDVEGDVEVQDSVEKENEALTTPPPVLHQVRHKADIRNVFRSTK